jgi:predicted ATPase/DNA-binding SARP family transcriptional activator
MPGLTLALIGPVTITWNEERLERFRTSRVQALLLYLVTEGALGASTHRREALMELLWPGLPLKSAQVNLRQTIYHLRQAIPDISEDAGDGEIQFLLSDRQTVRINPLYPVGSDLARFIRLLDGSMEQRIDATELYRGDFLIDFYLVDSSAYESWIGKRRAAFRRQALDALNELATFYTEQGYYKEAESFARHQIEIDNLRESAYRQLMKALAFSGRRSEALLEYEEFSQVLNRELGVEPSAETLSLLEKIRNQKFVYQQHEPLPSESIGPIAIPESEDASDREIMPAPPDHWIQQELSRGPSNNLPSQPGRFLGRELELAELDQFIADRNVRLITVAGPGGIGKTRLALAAAGQQLEKGLAAARRRSQEDDPSSVVDASIRTDDRRLIFDDGVYFVSLAELTTVDQMVTSIAETLDIHGQLTDGQSGAIERQVLDYLGDKRLLLIMDNFEHLLDGIDFLSEIIRNAPNVQLIVTSRERLHLRQEQLYPIRGLEYLRHNLMVVQEDIDSEEYPAGSLFLQSARRIRPGYEIPEGEGGHLNQICELVEGMPLAIELAAAWVDVLSLEEIAYEIRQSIDFLKSSERDLPRRQRNMRALFDSTLQRMGETERQVFSRLSIFRGGFTREAAQEVTGGSIRLLASLSGKSLLQYENASGRYQIHELVRQYGAEKLAQNPEDLDRVQDQHCAYFCSWLQQQEPILTGPERSAVLSKMEADGENLVLAWNRAVDRGDAIKLGQAIDGMARFFLRLGRAHDGERATGEAAKALKPSLSVLGDTEEIILDGNDAMSAVAMLLAKIITWQAQFLTWQRPAPEARKLFDESLALLDLLKSAKVDVRKELAFSKRTYGSSIWNYDPQLGTQLLKESLTLCRETDDQRMLAIVLNDLGSTARYRADYDEADKLLKECLEIQTILKDSSGMARVLLDLGWINLFQGKMLQAARFVRKGCGILFEMGGWVNISTGLNALGLSHFYQGEYQDSRTYYQQSIDILEYHAHKPLLALSNIVLGACLTHLGEYKEAYTTGQKGLAISEGIGTMTTPELARMFLSWAALGNESYSEVEILAREAVAIYRDKQNPERLAISLTLLGITSLQLGRVMESQRYIQEALGISITHRTILPLLLALTVTAKLLLEENEVEKAIELYALALLDPMVANSKWWRDAVGQHIEDAAASISAEDSKAVRARGRKLDLWQTCVSLLEELRARGWEHSAIQHDS